MIADVRLAFRRLGQTPVFTIFAVASLGLGIGATAVVARRIGEKDEEGAAQGAVQALALGTGIAVTLGVFGAAFAHELLGVMGATASMLASSIGYAQVYVAAGSGGGWWTTITDPGVRGIDQFLCEPQDLGKGLGTRMVKALVAKVFEDPSVTRIQTDPDPANARAIRCYEKAGLRAVETIVTPDGPALYMVLDRP